MVFAAKKELKEEEKMAGGLKTERIGKKRGVFARKN